MLGSRTISVTLSLSSYIPGSISNIGDDTDYKCRDGSSPEVRNKVISGVVGAASSVTSIQVANLLRLFKIPQVTLPTNPRCWIPLVTLGDSVYQSISAGRSWATDQWTVTYLVKKALKSWGLYYDDCAMFFQFQGTNRSLPDYCFRTTLQLHIKLYPPP